MGGLLRNARQSMAPVSAAMTALPSLFSTGTSKCKAALCIQSDRPAQEWQGGLPGAPAPPANSPGRCNGSILSLVNRAVKSNILKYSWHTAGHMVLKYDEDVQRACMRCSEWEAKWQVRAELVCKWCDWETRSEQVATPAWLAEVVPVA